MRHLLPRGWNRCTFTYFSYSVQVKTLKCIYKTNKTLKSGEKKIGKGPLDQRNYMVVNTLGFLFCFIYPWLKVEEASKAEISTITDLKRLNKSLLSLARHYKRSNLERQKTSRQNWSTRVKYHK